MKDEYQRGFFGVIIPLNVLDSNELTVSEKFIYAYIASYKKACFDSNARISERLKISEPTVSRSIKNLIQKKFILAEYVNNNNAKRRLYAIFDNPQKIKYLAKNGLFADDRAVEKSVANCDESNQNDETQNNGGESNQNDEINLCYESNQNESNQNDKMSNQNDETQNGGESNQNDYQRIKNKKKKEITEQNTNTTAGLAGSRPAGLARPERKNYKTTLEFFNACKKYRAGKSCGIEQR